MKENEVGEYLTAIADRMQAPSTAELRSMAREAVARAQASPARPHGSPPRRRARVAVLVAAIAVVAGSTGAAAALLAEDPEPPAGLEAAMESVRQSLMSDCFNEEETRQLISSTLSDIGVTEFEIRTDGPLAYPIEEEEAVRNHLAAGCFVYSTLGGGPNGFIFYIRGADA